MVQKMTFTSSMRNSNSSSVQPSLKSSPSSHPILFGTSKDLKLSPLRPSATKHSHDAIEENENGTQISPTAKRQKCTTDSSNTLSPSSPLSPTFSEPPIPEDQEVIEEIDLQNNTNGKRVVRSRKPKKQSENTSAH